MQFNVPTPIAARKIPHQRHRKIQTRIARMTPSNALRNLKSRKLSKKSRAIAENVPALRAQTQTVLRRPARVFNTTTQICFPGKELLAKESQHGRSTLETERPRLCRSAAFMPLHRSIAQKRVGRRSGINAALRWRCGAGGLS
jgi:hypothetical protein